MKTVSSDAVDSSLNVQAASAFQRRGLRRAGILGSLVILLASACTNLGASSVLSPEAKRDLDLQPGVVLIKVSFQASLGHVSCTAGASGTGFLYRPDGYLITNGHVAQWARLNDSEANDARMKTAIPCLAKGVINDVQNKMGRQLTEEEQNAWLAKIVEAIKGGLVRISGDPKIEVVLDNGSKFEGEIKAYSNPITEGGKDIAVIKIDGRNLPTVELGNSDEVNVGDPITVIGYPGLANISDESILVPTVTNGRISAIKKQDFKGTPVLQSEATINHGNSGGPGFDAKGHVIGVATFNTGGPGINFFVPIDTAMEFVRQAGSQPQRGPFDKLWADALDAYDGQHWSRAHDLIGSVLEMMPNEPDAKRLQLQAAANLPANPFLRLADSLGLPVLLGTAVGILLLLGAVMLLIRSSKGKPAAKQSNAVTRPMPRDVPSAPPSATAEPVPYRPAPPANQAALHEPASYGSLQIANGPLAGNRFVIPKNGLLIGRDPSRCAVVLPTESVGREHAWVVPLDNHVAVIDRSSVNGTYVNSTDSPRISKMILKDGDHIFVGRSNPTEITYSSS